VKIYYRLAMAAALMSFAGASAFAESTDCTAVASNLVQNCGFELGTYLDSNGVEVPNGWFSNDAFDSPLGFNNVRQIPHNGAYSLAIGNLDGDALAALSQTITDVVGAPYSGSLFVNYGGCCSDQGAFFDLKINDQVVLSLDSSTANAFLAYAFNFTGTGSDVLTIEGATLPSEWFVDDVVVTGETPGAPEPRPGLLCAASLLALVYLKRRVTVR